jgi:tetratricopeptide (TPR) repeat protein
MEEQALDLLENTETEEPNLLSRLKNRSVILATGVLGVLVLAVFSIWISVAQKKPDLTVQEQSFSREFNSSNFKQAEEIAKKGLEKDPENKAFLAGIIEVIASEGNQTGTEAQAFDRAKPYVTEALKVAPKDPKVLTAVGYLHEAAGKYNEALNYYNKAIESDPDFVQAYFRRSNTFNFLGKKNESQISLEKAYEQDPNNSLIQRAMADVFRKEGRLNEAYELYIKASSSSAPRASQAIAFASASQIKQLQGDIDTAVNLSQQSINLDSMCAPCFTAHGFNTSIKAGSDSAKIQEALGFLDKASRINPRISFNFLHSGYLLRQLKELDLSIESIKLAISKVDVDNTIVSPKGKNKWKGAMYYELAQTYSRKKDLANSVESLSNALNLDPSLKIRLGQDMQRNGYFNDIKNNESFKLLIG